MKILSKYIVKSVLGPFLFGIFAFTIMILGATFINLLREFEQYHLSLWTNLKLLSLYVPENFLYGSIMAVLVGTILGLGNLTGHSETTAMRAGGLNYYRLAGPVLMIGLIVSIGGILLNEYVTPLSYRMLDKMRADISSTPASGTIYHFVQPIFMDDQQLGKIIYANKYEPKTQQFENVLIIEKANGQLIRTIEASVMYWDGRSWFFTQGRINQISPENLYPIIVKRARVNYPLNLTPSQIVQSQIPPERQSISDLSRLVKTLSPQSPAKQRYLVDLYGKVAMPFASFIFALLGIPLALKPQRRSNSAGYGLCLLFVLLWWILYMMGTSMARMGILHPFIGAWFANFAIAGYGVFNLSHVKI